MIVGFSQVRLWRKTNIISTARQDFFGVGMIRMILTVYNDPELRYIGNYRTDSFDPYPIFRSKTRQGLLFNEIHHHALDSNCAAVLSLCHSLPKIKWCGVTNTKLAPNQSCNPCFQLQEQSRRLGKSHTKHSLRIYYATFDGGAHPLIGWLKMAVEWASLSAPQNNSPFAGQENHKPKRETLL